MVSFKILDLCPIALFQQLWNTLYLKKYVKNASAEAGNFLIVQKIFFPMFPKFAQKNFKWQDVLQVLWSCANIFTSVKLP